MDNINKINEVRDANNIVDVISSYVPLIKKGKNYFGVCPFHDDTNPSMSVSEEKQIFKCFSCGTSGNVFDFIMNYEHVDFKEALHILAEKKGIEIGSVSIKKKNDLDKYYEMYEISSKLYQNNLNTKLGYEAKEYLRKRNITDEAIKFFRIGVSLREDDQLFNFLTSKNYSLKELSDYGLSYNNKDLYINRIMFPLFDLTGKVVGFSGRIYNTKSDSKYVNTKETKIFKKGELLYNYHNAKEEARKAKFIIVVEGFMDVIRLYISGIKNVVAVMGTSFTKEQITLLKKLSNNIYLSLDGDDPGKRATYNIGNMKEFDDFNLKVIKLDNDYDPDSYIIDKGKESYLNLIEESVSFNEYKISYLKKSIDFSNIDQKTTYINQVLEEIKKEKDEIKEELLLNKLSTEVDLDVEFLRNKLLNIKKCSNIKTFEKEIVKKNDLDKYQKASYAILYYMLNDRNIINLYKKKLNYLPMLEDRYLANEIIYYDKMYGTIILADFLTYLYDKPELRLVLDKVLTENFAELKESDLIYDYFKVIEEYNCNQEIKRLKEKMNKETDPIEKAKLADKIRLIKIGS